MDLTCTPIVSSSTWFVNACDVSFFPLYKRVCPCHSSVTPHPHLLTNRFGIRSFSCRLLCRRMYVRPYAIVRSGSHPAVPQRAGDRLIFLINPGRMVLDSSAEVKHLCGRHLSPDFPIYAGGSSQDPVNLPPLADGFWAKQRKSGRQKIAPTVSGRSRNSRGCVISHFSLYRGCSTQPQPPAIASPAIPAGDPPVLSGWNIQTVCHSHRRAGRLVRTRSAARLLPLLSSPQAVPLRCLAGISRSSAIPTGGRDG